ncbi:LppA family lipoprotein [Nocardia terpenica]|uniref:Lipoprotein LppV n=2 Tax=Nocardia terpenica TaxID=455432 RepID=A0A164IQF2_9NOCA|nr:LppA family lipoprotein [Nocardia terpenica]KZM69659.1 hypothetical protein AWN90_07745 [Nocardia terpenica]
MKLSFERTTIVVGAIALALVVGAVLVIGRQLMTEGDSSKPTSDKETAAATQRLLGRPSLEDAEAQLRSAVEQIAAAGTDLIPGMQWSWNRERTPSGCDKPYDRTDGRIVYLQEYVSNTPVPDNVWQAFAERAHAIAAQVGATTPETMQNAPGNHDVWFFNPEDGTTIKIGSQVATVISGTVGCHLPASRLTPPTRPTS